MKKLLLLKILFSGVISCYAHSQSFNNGVNLQSTEVTAKQKYIGWDIDDLIQGSNVRSIAYINFNDGSKYFSLTNTNEIYSVNVSTKQFIGSWPLSNYPDMTMMSGEGPAIGNEILPSVSPESPEGKALGRPVYDQTSYYWHISTQDITCGCLNESPLRYGDLEGDGQKELVLLTVNNIVVFSPVSHKVIFASNYQMSDQMLPDTQEAYLDDILKSKYETLGENQPQLLAASSISHETQEPLGAVRSFGKIYIGHFSSETANDILLWRKLYTSRATSDPIKGFAKRAELLLHYKLIDGEYKKQETEQDVIKGWLEAKNLTWQKGYPSKSECPGQEDQLIPEMHDPLLNDPDVLK